jgi:drug/metabolite transporter (DMT)-like permease
MGRTDRPIFGLVTLLFVGHSPLWGCSLLTPRGQSKSLATPSASIYEMASRMKPIYLIILIVMNFFWAGSLSIYKVLAHHLSLGSIVTLRFGVAALLLIVIWPWMPGKAPRGFDLVKTVIMGIIVFTIGHRTQVYGDEIGTAGNSSVLMGMEPIITSVAAAIFLREHIGPRRWMGFVLGLLGIALLNGLLGGKLPLGGLTASLIFISSFICEAVYSIMGKPLIEKSGMLKTLTLALIFGTAMNLLIDGRRTILETEAMPANYWWLILYMATLCTSIGYAVWFVAAWRLWRDWCWDYRGRS